MGHEREGSGKSGVGSGCGSRCNVSTPLPPWFSNPVIRFGVSSTSAPWSLGVRGCARRTSNASRTKGPLTVVVVLPDIDSTNRTSGHGSCPDSDRGGTYSLTTFLSIRVPTCLSICLPAHLSVHLPEGSG